MVVRMQNELSEGLIKGPGIALKCHFLPPSTSIKKKNWTLQKCRISPVAFSFTFTTAHCMNFDRSSSIWVRNRIIQLLHCTFLVVERIWYCYALGEKEAENKIWESIHRPGLPSAGRQRATVLELRNSNQGLSICGRNTRVYLTLSAAVDDCPEQNSKCCLKTQKRHMLDVFMKAARVPPVSARALQYYLIRDCTWYSKIRYMLRSFTYVYRECERPRVHSPSVVGLAQLCRTIWATDASS